MGMHNSSTVDPFDGLNIIELAGYDLADRLEAKFLLANNYLDED